MRQTRWPRFTIPNLLTWESAFLNVAEAKPPIRVTGIEWKSP
jgi:hypothetical protein